MPEALMTLKQGIEPVWEAIERQRIIIRHRVVYAHASETKSIPSVLGAPVVAGDRMLGVLAVYHLHDHCHFSERDGAMLEIVGRQTGIAITNAQLFTETQRLATTDQLTGLFNRYHFFALAPRELERARRYRHDVALLIIDVDHFKTINDTYGHTAGDTALKHIANQRELRDTDIPARFGGEEFIALLPETNLTSALRVAGRLRATIEANPVLLNGHSIRATISAGCASLIPPPEMNIWIR
jgi:diguanylate cyclase with GAF sensor